ncbi:MAG: tRNA dihydrouridine synthase DusB [Actinomycetaceae bacterium]|nr:tRNA dihydrouridine synthase DusB [Actinomycetaceae bacterium]
MNTTSATTTGALQIGPIRLWTPVVLAPMAGVTDVPFRRLSREYGERGLNSELQSALQHAKKGEDAPAGLYVCEMITARALIEGNEKTQRMIEPDPQERVRSVQLYGVDPDTMGRAAELMVDQDLADHIDLNFGCPVPKVTRKGGGAALPWKRDLLEDILKAVVSGAERAGKRQGRDIPVTIKMRVGIDDKHQTYLDAGRIAQNTGVAAVALHGRTQAQYYSGHADWETIARLKETVNIPVMGNGDIFKGSDATSMMEQTGCDAVVIGRGCQGRPWLFTDITSEFTGAGLEPTRPDLREVVRVIREHSELMIEHMGNEENAMRNMRKHIGWYLRGFGIGGESRMKLGRVSSIEELDELVAQLDLDQPYPKSADGPRGRKGHARRPHLPDGWLDSQTIDSASRADVAANESVADGG